MICVVLVSFSVHLIDDRVRKKICLRHLTYAEKRAGFSENISETNFCIPAYLTYHFTTRAAGKLVDSYEEVVSRQKAI